MRQSEQSTVERGEVKKFLFAAAAFLALAFLPTTTSWAANPHELKSNPITCVLNSNNTVTCSGSVVGLGNEPVIVQVDVPSGCATRGNQKQPPGHLQGQSQPIQPHNGRIDFSVTTNGPSCPPGLNPVVGDYATVTIINQEGQVVFRERVPITQ